MSKIRDHLYRIAKYSTSETIWKKAKQARNNCNNYARFAKQHFFKSEFNFCKNQNDPRKGWKILNRFLPNSRDDKNIGKIISDNTIILEPFCIANYFNNYYVNIAKKLTCNLNHDVNLAVPVELFMTNANVSNQFEFKNVTFAEVFKLVK